MFNKFRLRFKVFEEISKTTKKLNNIYLSNKKNNQKINNNLIKFILNINLIWFAYIKINLELKLLDLTVDKDLFYFFNFKKVTKILKLIKKKKITFKGQLFKFLDFKINIFFFKSLNVYILQELIRIIINIIYSPTFQYKKFNFNSTPSLLSIFSNVLEKNKSFRFVLKGNLQRLENCINFDILLKILKLRILDKKFLMILKKLLKQKIIFKKNIFYSIFLNIYFNEFDYIVKKEITQKFNVINKIKLQKKRIILKFYCKIIYYIRIKKYKIKKFISKNKNSNFKFFYSNIKILRKLQKKIKSLQIIKFLFKKPLKVFYIRYNSEWIIFTNSNKYICYTTKNLLLNWLYKKFKLITDQIFVVDLYKKKITFLGFSIFLNKKLKYYSLKTKIFLNLIIGIDHKTLKKKLIEQKILNTKFQPLPILNLIKLKPQDIVKRIKRKLEKLFNYYFKFITFKSELKVYYFIYNFCCRFTLGYREKLTINKITQKYGVKLLIPYYSYILNKKIIIKKVSLLSFFPTYNEIMKKYKLKCS